MKLSGNQSIPCACTRCSRCWWRRCRHICNSEPRTWWRFVVVVGMLVDDVSYKYNSVRNLVYRFDFCFTVLIEGCKIYQSKCEWVSEKRDVSPLGIGFLLGHRLHIGALAAYKGSPSHQWAQGGKGRKPRNIAKAHFTQSYYSVRRVQTNYTTEKPLPRMALHLVETNHRA